MKVGILGAARIAPKAIIHPAHVRGDVSIQAVAARNLSRAQAFAEKHDIAEAFDDYQAVIDHPDIDLIYNPLPINLHAEWTIKALKAGNHVLCEKPFAMNADEAHEMFAAAEAAGKRVIEAFHYRYHPAFMQMMAWLDAGQIGTVQSINAEFNAPISDKNGTEIRHLPETGGGAFMDLGCYPLSWALMVAGGDVETVEATATLTPRGVDETMSAKLTFTNGARAELSSSMAEDEPFAATLEITGKTGRIHFTNPLAPHWGARLTLEANGKTETATIERSMTYFHQLNTVAEALESGETLPTEGEAILRQQRAIDAVYAAAGLRDLRYR